MPGWRNWFLSGSSFTHPDSPIGGTGPGASRLPGPGNIGWRSSRLPHPDSPASHGFLWGLVLEAVDLEERAEAVYTAFGYAERELPRDILDATGEDLHNLVSEALRGLLIALVIVAVPTAAGAVIGGIFGVGVGAVAGGAIGLDVGLWILEYFGLALLAGYLVASLYEAAALAREGGRIAWDSVDQPQVKDLQLRIAGGKMAQAATIIVRGLLQGIVAFLVAKGASAAASRVPELVNSLRNSKFGSAFATWIENNWERLIENPKLRDKPIGSGGGTDEEAPLARAPAKREKPAAPPKQDLPPEGLAVRKDLNKHLAGPDGFNKKTGKINGTHNSENAIRELKAKNATYQLRPTSTPGISELDYKYVNPANGKTISSFKTVYDPSVYSDQRMLDMAQQAGESGFAQHLASPNSQGKYFATQNGVNFQIYINNDPSTGKPYVGSVFPVK